MRIKQLSRDRVSRNQVARGKTEGPRAKTPRPISPSASASPSAEPKSRAKDHSSLYQRARTVSDRFLHHFESYLQQHSLSPTTIRNYLADLRAFFRWQASRKPRSRSFAPGDFHAYRNYLCFETDHSTATVNRRLQSLRLFGRFLQEMGHVLQNPTREIELVRNGNGAEPAPRILTRAEIVRLAEAIQDGRPSLVPRDYAIMQLMLQAGLRVHEVATLRLRDLLPAREGMNVEVRGNRHAPGRRVPLNPVAARAVREYIATRPAIPRVDHLFVSQRGQPLSMRSIQRIIDTYARRAGLHGVCAQSLRHTCAKAMLEETADRALVARWLGHKSERVLGRYHSQESSKRGERRVNGN